MPRPDQGPHQEIPPLEDRIASFNSSMWLHEYQVHRGEVGGKGMREERAKGTLFRRCVCGSPSIGSAGEAGGVGVREEGPKPARAPWNQTPIPKPAKGYLQGPPSQLGRGSQAEGNIAVGDEKGRVRRGVTLWASL